MLTLEDIKRKIQESQEKASQIAYEKDPGFDMCKEYARDNHVARPEQLAEIDIVSCMKCLIYLNSNKKISPEECENIAEIIDRVFENQSIYSFTQLFGILSLIVDYDNYQQILDYIKEPNNLKAKDKLDMIPEPENSISQDTKGDLDDEDYKYYLSKIRTRAQEEPATLELLHFLENHDHLQAIIYALAMLKTRKKIEHDLIEIATKAHDQIHVSSRILNRAIAQTFNQLYSTKHINSVHNTIKNFVTEEEKKMMDAEKAKERVIRQYQKTLKLLEMAKEEPEIKNVREIIKSIPDGEIKEMILRWIYEHNAHYYEQLDNRLEELNAKSMKHYLSVLRKHNVSLHIQDIPSIMHNTPEEIEQIFQLLPLREYKEIEIIRILQNTTKSIAERVKRYLLSGFISADKVMEHISIYYQSDSKLSRMDEAVERINRVGINPQIFETQPEYYWQDVELLEKNLATIVYYHLGKGLRSGENYGFLLEEDLTDKIDRIIELGFESYLEENVELLNYPKVRWQRVELLKQMNVPVEDMDTLEEVLDSPKFVVDDKSLENYLIDYASLQKEEPQTISKEELKELEQDKISMMIGDSIISIPKVRRGLQEGKTLWKAIFDGKRVGEEEYKQMMSVLTGESSSKN